MEIPILIELVEAGRFRAQAGSPFGVSAEGATETEAAQRLSELIGKRLACGARLATISVPNGASGGTPFPADNLYKTDWAYRELQEAIEENRQREDSTSP